MKLFVISNCATLAYVHSFNALLPGSEIHGCDFAQLLDIKKIEENKKRILDADYILTPVEFQGNVSKFITELGKLKTNFVTLPNIYFDRYHPDIVFLRKSEIALHGKMGAYHSAIISAAYSIGYKSKDVKRLFNEKTYLRLGYLGGWREAKSEFLRPFSDAGINLEDSFINWGRHKPFMYSVNHAQPDVYLDIAVKIAINNFGLTTGIKKPYIFDIHANGIHWPVYPEIGELYGVEGTMNFKLLGTSKYIGLEEFIDTSYNLYNEHFSENTKQIIQSTSPVSANLMQRLALELS